MKNLSDSSRKLSRLAILSALGAAVLFLAAVLPGGRLALIAISGIFSAAALLMYGFGWSLTVYAVTSVLSLLILPAKMCAVFYAAFFGFYPLLKSVFERKLPRPLYCWLAKILIFSAVFWVWWFVPAALGVPSGLLSRWYILWPVGILAFVIYDICFSFLIKFYLERISGYFQ